MTVKETTEEIFVKCPSCKTETSLDLFEKKENWETIKESLTLLGFDTEKPQTLNHFKELVKGYCIVCGEAKLLKELLVTKLKTHIPDQETEKAILQTLDDLIDLSKESQWRECKSIMVKTLCTEKLHKKTAWRLFMVLVNVNGQSQHVEEAEAGLMRCLAESNYSLSELAWIFGRSKETVFRHTKRKES